MDETLTKKFVLMKDVICKYHPDFKSGKTKSNALKNPNYYNVEHLIELTMAHVGGYRFVDGDLYDFSDKSECKTASIDLTSGYCPTSFTGAVQGIMTLSGSVKIGNLRIVLFNQHTNDLKFVFLPKDIWDPGMREFGEANKRKIRFTWNSVSDNIKKFSDYMCDDFYELSKKK